MARSRQVRSWPMMWLRFGGHVHDEGVGAGVVELAAAE